jgi:hypothetical protein
MMNAEGGMNVKINIIAASCRLGLLRSARNDDADE